MAEPISNLPSANPQFDRPYQTAHTQRRWHKRKPIALRFWAKVDKNGPVPPHMPHLGRCWIWKNGVTPYPNFYFCGRNLHANIVSWILTHGAKPKKCVLHKCDNARCVRPDHLFLGTRTENSKDKMKKKRHCFGVRNGHAKINEEDVRFIRAAQIDTKILAERFGLTRTHINHIRSLGCWKHVQ